MRSNTRALLLLLGLFILFVALNFVFLVEENTSQEDETKGSRSSYRTTPYGTLALYTLLEESDYPVTRLESPYTNLQSRDDISTLVIISPPADSNPNQEELESLNEWISDGGLVIIIDREIFLDFDGESVRTAQRGSKPEARPLQPTRYTEGVEQVALSPLASQIKLDSQSAIYHLGDETAAILADLKVGQGRVVLLTDPFIVANNGIVKADNVILSLNLFAERPAGKIAFDEYHHGYGRAREGGIMSYFKGTPVPWMLAQAGLIALLVVYSYGRRFARPLPLLRERRTTNLEFVSSMANITRLARATDLAMQNIYSEFRKRLCRYGGLPSTAQTRQLAAAAARRARLSEDEISRLLARCEQVARGSQVSDAEMLDLVKRIRQIESLLGL
jgi:uncharacterized protein DUF4350